MAFAESKMSKLGNLKPPATEKPDNSFWVYEGAEVVATQVAAGFYNPWRGQLQVGDKILSIGTDAGKLLIVTAVPKTGNVTTAARVLS